MEATNNKSEINDRPWKSMRSFLCIRNLGTVNSDSHRNGSEGITTELKMPIIIIIKCPRLKPVMLHETGERKSEMNLLFDFRKVTFFPGE